MGAVEVLRAVRPGAAEPARADRGRRRGGCALDAAAGDPRAARKQIARLSAAGLVESRGGAFVARLDRIRDAVDELAGADDDAAAAARPARVRALFRRGRLVEIPRAPELRLQLLRHGAERFEAGRTYREPEVNELLREVHDDHAALRRYLVDAGLLGRDDDGATYWRA